MDSLLCPANDWLLEADLDDLPNTAMMELVGSAQRPDLVLYSRSLRVVVLYEHTCPMEERIMAASQLKKKRYEILCRRLSEEGWKVHIYTGEVGCRGAVSLSLRFFLKDLGVSKHDVKVAIRSLSQAALFCSHFIWMARRQKQFVPISIPVTMHSSLHVVQDEGHRKTH